MAPAELLIASARALLEEHGWVRHHLYGPRGYCVVGALRAAALGDQEALHEALSIVASRCPAAENHPEPLPEDPERRRLVEEYRWTARILAYNDSPGMNRPIEDRKNIIFLLHGAQK